MEGADPKEELGKKSVIIQLAKHPNEESKQKSWDISEDLYRFVHVMRWGIFWNKVKLCYGQVKYICTAVIELDEVFDSTAHFHSLDTVKNTDAVNGKAQCRATADDGVELMRILDAIYRTAETGKSVDIVR